MANDQLSVEDVALRERFQELVNRWKNERGPHSSSARLTSHAAYQDIIGMGPAVVPLLLKELEQFPDHWFRALHELTGADPVPETSRGRNAKWRVPGWNGLVSKVIGGEMAIDHRQFPMLVQTGYRITSIPDAVYNCIAWVAGETDAWWWPDSGNYDYWPPGVPRQETVDAFTKAFESLGYVDCVDDGLEAGWEKIALYALNGSPTHAARQLPNGLWTSKLGPEDDIEHTLEGLSGPLYGAVVRLFRRASTSPNPVT